MVALPEDIRAVVAMDYGSSGDEVVAVTRREPVQARAQHDETVGLSQHVDGWPQGETTHQA